MQRVTILGSTGSIGISTLDVLQRNPHKYRVYALAANKSVDGLFEQCQQFKPAVAVMLCPESAAQLEEKLRNAGLAIKVQSGMQALEMISSTEETDVVVAAIVGAAGLLPTLAAAKAGKRILLANKEALVMSGALLMSEVQANNAVLLPVDSEHNAIWQCMPVSDTQQYHFENKGIRRIILTASGGPFRDWNIADLEDVTPEQAVAHPNWSMGQKISVDSATMMNKGLEVIEAHWLFGMSSDKIEVVLHRQSIIHSMVDYVDGSVLAQMGNPDMRTPIANTLAWPERIDSGVEALDLVKAGRLDFAAADFERFPCLALAYQALKAGGTSTAILNAANEVAVEAFLNRQIKFTDIARIIAEVLEIIPSTAADSLEQILSADEMARKVAHQQMQVLCNH
ncbi:MAG: 1-deoxy-D-xylulose-5-phosphate reductoisomerase [Methylophaga nitratireducenticrescens]|uniref:1-deoxy-D-xylulose-5-phosphate reductoisomerase n=1 Tax=Methylophaga sp. SB9B TaxID=2570356 RepID=UPI0010A92BCF|nr:1-deoxy-D-xylulose-5-phosphate reductoisomerase [Methylophaga sp. SB9B]THF67825.1 MAG: 1-deoxy-D-xylulose-5-phosphate reductoisomerase [Methylophaga nitratireducenticrescens]THK43273.1 1-deoxy-D-xylulose-5-phosphate reductoisomerase [Methylophaga sp. SB9B]